MIATPRILIIDDELGFDEKLRTDFCNALRLTPHVWGEDLPISLGTDQLALATFVRAQRDVGGQTENDLQQAINAVAAGWPFKDGGRWALICLDLYFSSGLNGKLKEEFGKTILEAIQGHKAPQGLQIALNDQHALPVIMLSGETVGRVEDLLGVDANVPVIDKWGIEAGLNTDALLRRFGKLLFSKGLIEDGALRYVDSHGSVKLVERKTSEVIVGSSLPMLATLRDARSKLARGGNAKILVTGERGSGKELLTGYLHDHRPVAIQYIAAVQEDKHGIRQVKNTSPLIVVNLQELPNDLFSSTLKGYVRGAFTGAIQDTLGLIALAGNGTLHLDEIANLHYGQLQTLLRLTENSTYMPVGDKTYKPILCQFVATTNKNMEKAMANNLFPEDLYDRFEKLEMPPLRERTEDIELLFRTFLKREVEEIDCSTKAISNDVWPAVQAKSWQGNVRQLRSIVAALVSLREHSGHIHANHFEYVWARAGDQVRATWDGGLDELITLINAFEIADTIQLDGTWTQVDHAMLRLQGRLIAAAVARTRTQQRKFDRTRLVRLLTGKQSGPSEAGRWIAAHFKNRLAAFGNENELNADLVFLFEILAPGLKNEVEQVRATDNNETVNEP